jgi:uncharacterized membrane protein (UPF0127 family)
VLATAEVADGLARRSKGLLGRSGYEGAMVLPRTRSVHTMAFCDKEMVVVGVARLRPWRVGIPRRRGRSVIEAEAGAFERWGLKVGDQLELRG